MSLLYAYEQYCIRAKHALMLGTGTIQDRLADAATDGIFHALLAPTDDIPEDVRSAITEQLDRLSGGRSHILSLSDDEARREVEAIMDICVMLDSVERNGGS